MSMNNLSPRLQAIVLEHQDDIADLMITGEMTHSLYTSLLSYYHKENLIYPGMGDVRPLVERMFRNNLPLTFPHDR